MSENIVIKLDRVSKFFKLPHEKHGSIKDIFINGLRKKRIYEKQQVLNNVSFEIKKGEFFGIVGRNGSGKSTLLKLIAGIYYPDLGGISVDGKLVPFIELGVGFNPELTGRENVFLNGALLGFSRAEMEAMYEEIVAFAELERFMDQKLKNYSSGMQVRLAFSIAIKAEGNILLLDEVLAVGDAAFQKKCTDYFEKLKEQKKTVVLVTHDMAAVEKFCTRAILLDKGFVRDEGDPKKIAEEYLMLNTSGQEEQSFDDKKFIKEHGVKYTLKKGGEKKGATDFNYGDTAIFELKWESPAIKNIGIALSTKSGEYIYGTNTIAEKIKLDKKSVSYKLQLNLSAGEYKFIIGFFGEKASDRIYFIEKGLNIFVKNEDPTWTGLVKLESNWSN